MLDTGSLTAPLDRPTGRPRSARSLASADERALPTPDERRAVAIRPARADEWGRWRETRLRMLRDDADFFSTRYDDMVREPDQTWRDWVGEAAVGDQKTLFVADEDGELARRRRRDSRPRHRLRREGRA